MRDESLRQSAPGDLLSGARGCLFAEALDLMVVRELTGGVYFGEPKQIIDLGNGQKRAIDTQVYHTYEIERIGRVAFELAGSAAKRVPSFDERNVMKSGVLWDEVITALRAGISRC